MLENEGHSVMNDPTSPKSKKKPRDTRYKLVLFDMDGTLLQGRSIFVFAEYLKFTEELHQIFKITCNPMKKVLKLNFV